MFSKTTELAAAGTAVLAKNDLENGAKKIGKSAGDAVKGLQDDANMALEDLSTNANKYGENMRGWLDNLATDANATTKKVEENIKANPVQSTFIALAAGVVIGALLRR